MTEKYLIDPDRRMFQSGYIMVRAKNPEGGFESVCLAQLDQDSLLRWLRSRGGDNPWAENVVGILLGHGHLHRDEHDSPFAKRVHQ